MIRTSLLAQSDRPLFLIGQEKNAGKTVTLNRLRREARRLGEHGYGLVTVGWDGEQSDHLTGGEKPRVTIYEDDLVLTAGDLLAKATAKVEVLWSASLAGRVGRLVIGRCVRAGEIELVGTTRVSQLSAAIARMQDFGARRVLIDGAADRQTPIGAVKNAHVGLVLMGKRRESLEGFVARAMDMVMMYQLPQTEQARPRRLAGDDVALREDGGWTAYKLEDLVRLELDERPRSVWVGGPLTGTTLDALRTVKIAELIVDDPSRLFVPARIVRRLQMGGSRVTLAHRPVVEFISVRCEGGRLRELPPNDTIRALKDRIAPIACFDPWASAELLEASC